MIKLHAYSLKELKKEYDNTIIQYIINDFKCKRDTDIEKFVKNDMLLSEEKGNTRSYFIICENNEYPKVLGFYSLKLSSFPLDKNSEYMKFLDSKHDNIHEHIPTYYIVFLARCDGIDKGLLSGHTILHSAIKNIQRAKDYVAWNIVTIDAKQKSVCEIYKSFGFKQIHSRYDKQNTNLTHFIMPLEE